MSPKDGIYRRLQQHLDRQAVGFPAARSGAELRLLKRLFTPEEAKLALQLSYQPAPIGQITADPTTGFSLEQTEVLLNSMFMKGAIAWQEKDGSDHWYLIPLVVGMYEAQADQLDPEFLADAGAYMQTLSFGKSFLAVKPPQMRTIPIHKSLPVEHPVASYDQIRAIIQNSPGPFIALECICRKTAALKNKPCSKTARLETCLGFGAIGAMLLRRKQGRAVSRDEALAILQENEEDGLVLQPANAQQPEFVCSCCGCCCGMLSCQKFLPRPLDFWTSNFSAEISADACSRCGKCVTRCQVKAVTLTGPQGKARINLNRCIGCGLCIPTCPAKAVRLKKKEPATIPPQNTEELYDRIMANKKGAWGQLILLLKTALRMRP